MSVAVQEAVVLRTLLDERQDDADPLSDLAERFFVRIQDCLAAPWSTAISDFAHPKTRGERPPDLESRLRYGAALVHLAARDPEVHRLMGEVTALLRPATALREPELERRVTELVAAAA